MSSSVRCVSGCSDWGVCYPYNYSVCTVVGVSVATRNIVHPSLKTVPRDTCYHTLPHPPSAVSA